VRFTALSIGYNIAVALFGGFTSFIATFLVRVTGNNHARAVYVIIAAIITLGVLLKPRLGGANLHSPHYDFNDEILPLGASYWVRLAESILSKDRAAAGQP
jgi:hypothetical protein